MQQPRKDRDQLIEHLLELSQSMRKLHGLARSPWPKLDLSMAQLKVLMTLVQSGGLMSKDLADRLGVGPSAVTPLVDRLVREKLARREADPHDRRVVWIHPTDKAERLSEQIQALNRGVFTAIVEQVSDGDVPAMGTVLAKLVMIARALSAANRPTLAPTRERERTARVQARDERRRTRAHRAASGGDR